MQRQGRGRLLESLFDPRSVTIVGASDDPAKWGHTLARRALESCGGRPVLLVNSREVQLQGRPTYRTVVDGRDHTGLPVDLVVLCVPAAQLLAAVDDALAAGAQALVVITAGLSELDAEGAVLQREVVDRAHAAGATVLGPNCLGVVDTSTKLQLTYDLLAEGDVTVVSQSGNAGLDMAALLAERGLGVSRFVSMGNQADLTVIDVMDACVGHESTRAVAVYVEDVVDGRAFMTAAAALRDAGKPVVLVSPGRSAAAVRGAVSHTGALTTTSAVLDAACASVGARRVDTLTHLADAVLALRDGRRMAGPRAAVLTDGGGHGAIAADALTAAGLECPVLAEHTGQELRTSLWPNSVVSNPVDLAGVGEQDPLAYARALATLLGSGEVDGVMMTGYFGAYSGSGSAIGTQELAAAEQIAALVTGQRKPLVVQTMQPDSPSARVLRAAGVPVHRDVDRAVAVLASLVEPMSATAWPPALPTPAPAAPVVDTSYESARRLFAEAGVPFGAAATVRSEADLDEVLASARLGFPLVLKALGRQHKSEGGGVLLGLHDADATRTAYATLVDRLRPPAVSVERMVDTAAGVEVVVGCVRDPRFGPVLMVGLGGVYAEVLADTAVAVAPVSPSAARRLLLSLRGASLLVGTRGRAPVDLEGLAEAASRVSLLAIAHEELVELELNPVLAGPTGVVALDARLVRPGHAADQVQASRSRR